jgi:hypothetical protein
VEEKFPTDFPDGQSPEVEEVTGEDCVHDTDPGEQAVGT